MTRFLLTLGPLAATVLAASLLALVAAMCSTRQKRAEWCRKWGGR